MDAHAVTKMQNSGANLIHFLFECGREHTVKTSDKVMETDSDALRSILDKSSLSPESIKKTNLQHLKDVHDGLVSSHMFTLGYFFMFD